MEGTRNEITGMIAALSEIAKSNADGIQEIGGVISDVSDRFREVEQ